MRTVDIIMKKRDGYALEREEILAFVQGVTTGALPVYQASALLMAILLRGMTTQETAWLTDAMVHSGIKVDLSDLPGVKVDKHSTGGVGDKTSLVLAPIAAACGVPVPMMSGRGLGHTGGTLDKLESIPGFRTALSLDEMRAALERDGCAMIGQTDADRPRRQDALRPARRHGHRREHPAHQRLDHEQEDRGRHRCAGARRQDRQRCLHEDRGRLARGSPSRWSPSAMPRASGRRQ